MKIQKIHYITGIVITLFAGIHLLNHLFSIAGAEKHIEIMNTFRLVYRNIIIELILLLSVLIQIISGLVLFKKQRKSSRGFFEKLHIYSGLYLALFFMIHVSAVLAGRTILNLDTNFYFGVAGINYFPTCLFFIPYYGLAIISFFGHISAIHHKKMKTTILSISPKTQAYSILIVGCILTLFIFYGLTNHFSGVTIPEEYGVLIGK